MRRKRISSDGSMEVPPVTRTGTRVSPTIGKITRTALRWVVMVAGMIAAAIRQRSSSAEGTEHSSHLIAE